VVILTKTKKYFKRFSLACLALNLILSNLAVFAQAAPPVDSTFKLYMIGESHIDTAWMWPYQHTADTVIRDTFKRAIDALKSIQSQNSAVGPYKFAMSASKHYDWFKEYYYQDWDSLVDLVHNGQWDITGGQVVEADLQCPSGEALARQGLYAQHFFEKEFGKGFVPKVGFHPDTFGHSGQYPQFLKKTEMDYFTARRIQDNPSAIFCWEGIDGSNVLSFKTGASDGVFDRDGVQRKFNEAYDPLNMNVKTTLAFFGLGDHGGGPTVGTGANSYGVVGAANDITDAVVEYGTATKFFDEIDSTYPHWPTSFPKTTGELHTGGFQGCYTSWSGIKKYNRQNEILAETAEKAATLGYWTGAIANNGASRIELAWDRILTMQFHDVLPGSSSPIVYYEAFNKHEMAKNLLTNVQNNALLGLAYRADTSVCGVPVFVYNPLSWARDGEVTVKLHFSGELPQYVEMRDGATLLPTNITDRNTVTNSLTVSFISKDVPSLGYKVFSAAGSDTPPGYISALTFDESSWVIQNEYLKLTLNPDTGYIKSLVNKRNSQESFAQNAGTEANELHVYYDDGGSMPAWNVVYEQISREPEIFFDTAPVALKVVENSAGKVTVMVTKKWQDSIVSQYISMYQGIDRVDVRMEVNWTKPNHLLKVSFPILANADQASYEIAYGALQRTTLRGTSDGRRKFEQSGHKWMDITDQSNTYGVSILNDAKYGYDVWKKLPGDPINTGTNKGNETFVRARITAVRSPRSATLIGGLPSAFGPNDAYIDTNFQEFTYSIYPHENSWQDAKTVREAHELCYPMQSFQTVSHGGNGLSSAHSFLSVDKPNVIIGAVKNPYAGTGDDAGDENTFVIRVYESTGRDTDDVTIAMPSNVISVEEVNLLEHMYTEGRGIDPARIVTSGNLITLKKVNKYEIITLRAQVVGFGQAKVDLPQSAVDLSSYFNLNGLSPDNARSNTTGGFNGTGGTIPAEKWVDRFDYQGVEFRLADTASVNNFVVSEGQSIDIPVGNYNKAYLVGASADAESVSGDFTVYYSDGTGTVKNIEFAGWRTDLSGWDRYANEDTKSYVFDSIAHVFSHFHSGGTDQCDVENYLFVYTIDLDSGKTLDNIVLPDAPGIRIAAISVSNSPIPGFPSAHDAFSERPAMINGVIARLAGDNLTVNVEWEPSESDVLRYVLYCGHTPDFALDDADSRIVIACSQTQYSFMPTTLNTFYIRVVALDRNGMSSPPSPTSNAVVAGADMINYCVPEQRKSFNSTAGWVAGELPEYAIDGLPYNGRKWCQTDVSNVSPSSLVVKLRNEDEEPAIVNCFRVFHGGTSERLSYNTLNFDIDYGTEDCSLTTGAWTNAFEIRGNTDSATIHVLEEPIEVRYVRLTILHPSQSPTASASRIYQFMAIGYNVQPEQGETTKPPDPVSLVSAEVLPDGGTVRVDWKAPDGVNVKNYSVYRGLAANFEPSDNNKVGTVTGTDFLYYAENAGPNYFKVIATDIKGFASAPSGSSNLAYTTGWRNHCLYPQYSKAVWASSYVIEREAAVFACDGDVNGTKWCSTTPGDKYLYVQLVDDADQPVGIQRFMLYHAGRDSVIPADVTPNFITSAFSIDYSDQTGITETNCTDGSLWTNIKSISGNTSAITQHDLDSPIVARYLRLTVSVGAQTGANIARIYQFMAYGMTLPDFAGKATNVAAALYGETSVNITWTASPGENISRYAVYYGQDADFDVNGAKKAETVGGDIASITFNPPDTGTYYFKVVAINNNGFASGLSDPSNPVTITKAALAGFAVIDNTKPLIGDILTATLTNGNNATAIESYVWKAYDTFPGDGVVIGNEKTYSVTNDDFSKRITVDITNDRQTGSAISIPTARVEKGNASKALRPVLESKTSKSVRLVSVPGYEYACAPRNGYIPGVFVSNPEFTQLTPNTEYDFYQRIAEIGDTKASDVSVMLIVRTNDSDEPEIPNLVKVSGMVKSYNPKNPVTISLLQGDVEKYSVKIPEAAGSGFVTQPFSIFNVAPGDYTLVITKPAHTSFTVNTVTVVDDDVDLTGDSRPTVQLMTLRCGDIDGDNSINDADLTILWQLGNYNLKTTAAADKLCDLNGDGMINDIDLTILWLAYNYNRSEIVIW